MAPRDGPAMRGLELLEGERVSRVVRPHPLGRLGDYGPALALLALAAVVFAAQAGAEARGLAAWLDANTSPLALPLLLLLWWAGLGLASVPFALRRARGLPVAYGVVVASAGGFAAILLTMPDPSAVEALPLLPWLSLAAVPVPVALGELERRSPTWLFTNLRLVRREGTLRLREESWRLHRLERVALERRGPRALDYGDLVVAREGGEVRIAGVRPLARLRDELELLLHTQPEAPYLGEQRDTAERVAKLLRPGDGPGR